MLLIHLVIFNPPKAKYKQLSSGEGKKGFQQNGALDVYTGAAQSKQCPIIREYGYYLLAVKMSPGNGIKGIGSSLWQ